MHAKTQTLVTPNGERLVVLPEAEYNRLMELVEDAEDAASIELFKARLARGAEEFLPDWFVKRSIDGENRLKLWREYRGLTMAALAEKSGVRQPFISEIEAGKKEGSVATLKKLADALRVTVDDLI
ncbi:XRE family transcriptional regulator [Rhodomicrobium udaipurense JA643]|nr:XRE family transcriptional regulator [Rhodomicrobium udaipurense JA643]